MPKETSAKTKGENGKPPERSERPSSRSSTPLAPSLQQLKDNVISAPGIIKNAEDGFQHLVKKQWILPEQTVTCEHLTAVLLTLVVAQGPRTSADRISDNTANVIKAVAFLLEEATISQYAEKIANRIANLPTPPNTRLDDDTPNPIKESLETLSKAVQNQAEIVQKANEKIQEIQDSIAHVTSQTVTNTGFSYRDALMNGTISRPPTQIPPSNVHEAKLQNRLNIEACQLLITIQPQTANPSDGHTPPAALPTGLTKTAINNWLANKDIEDPPPPNSIVRAITEYRNNKLLIETNTRAAAKWLKINAVRVLQPLIGRPIKTLDRLYQVIGRFMPVQFRTDEEGIREFENSANLPAESISHITWLKNPERRSPTQTCANVKIHCKSAEAANTLILGSGRISHLGSQLRLHKDIKTPGTCNQCQKYGHIAPDCKETSPTCAKCGESHRTSECTTRGTKCTPCGSSAHQTNDDKCPERIDRENASLDRKPEAFTPYYITDERWTWGLHANVSTNRPSDTEHSQQDHESDVINTRQGRIHPRRPAQQRTLINSGFLRKPVQTGTNNIPLGNGATRGKNPPNPPPHRPAPPNTQQATTSQNVQPTQPTHVHQ